MSKLIGKVNVTSREVCNGKYIDYRLTFCVWDSDSRFLRTFFTMKGQGNADTPGFTYAFKTENAPAIDDYDFPRFVSVLQKLRKGFEKQSFPVSAIDSEGKPYITQNDLERLIQASKKLGLIVENDMPFEWTTEHPARQAARISAGV